jgi:hypothetical protein
VRSQGVDYPATWADFGESQLHRAAHPLTNQSAIVLAAQQVSPSRPICTDPGGKSQAAERRLQARRLAATPPRAAGFLDEDAIFTDWMAGARMRYARTGNQHHTRWRIIAARASFLTDEAQSGYPSAVSSLPP